MNLRQLCVALKSALQAQVWTGGSVVFADSSVKVTVGPKPQAVADLRMPAVLIAPADAQADPQYGEAPGLVQQRVVVTVLVRIENDRFGEAALLGAGDPVATASPGKGLLEVEERVLAAILLLNQQNSVNIQFSHAGAAGAVLSDGTGYIATRDYYFDALITTTTS